MCGGSHLMFLYRAALVGSVQTRPMARPLHPTTLQRHSGPARVPTGDNATYSTHQFAPASGTASGAQLSRGMTEPASGSHDVNSRLPTGPLPRLVRVQPFPASAERFFDEIETPLLDLAGAGLIHRYSDARFVVRESFIDDPLLRRLPRYAAHGAVGRKEFLE